MKEILLGRIFELQGKKVKAEIEHDKAVKFMVDIEWIYNAKKNLDMIDSLILINEELYIASGGLLH